MKSKQHDAFLKFEHTTYSYKSILLEKILNLQKRFNILRNNPPRTIRIDHNRKLRFEVCLNSSSTEDHIGILKLKEFL